MSSALTPIEVFCSYAHEDESYLQKLKVHLSGLERQGLISTWYDRQIPAGTNWAEAIDNHLETDSLILLLVTADFLASDYCYKIEMQRAIQRHEASEALVIPIIVCPSDWEHTPFAHLQSLPRDGQPITTWENQDVAWHDVAAGIRRAIEDLPLLAKSAPHAELPAVWNIPYPRNHFFIGRDDLLSRLHTQLQAGQVTAISQSPQAISGLGGIGKTHLAIEYAYRYHQDYEVVLWARAENQETLIASYNTIATLLNLPEREAQQQEITIQAVKRWLQTHRKWLLILDNADDLNLLPNFLPPVPRGHILITTRAWDMQRLAQRIEVETLPLEQGTEFLLRRAALIAPNATLEQTHMEDRKAAMQIVQELGGLPLALDQAGAYLEATGMSLSQYLQIYQQHRHKLLQERRARVAHHPEPVATTWSLSFKQVEEQNAAAAELLRFCAYLAPDAIPENIITEGAPHLGSLLKPVAADPFLLSQAIEALRAYSLIQRDPRTQTLSVHRLVQTVLQDEMDEKSRKLWATRVIRAVHAAVPPVEHKNWLQWERVVLHVQVCAQHIKDYKSHLREAAKLLQQTGWYLTERARYSEAEPLLVQAYKISEAERGTEHLDTSREAGTLAYLYKAQGKYAEAEPLYLRALQIRERQLGPEHPSTATSLNNLAGLYRGQGKYAEAEPLYLRALQISERQLGPEHPDTATSLNNLAFLYQSQGKYAEAEPLYLRALQISERQLGPEHPSTATSLNNLAFLYQSQGKYAEAEPLYLRALQISERQLGPEHPSTATSLNNLAFLYQSQGKYAEAEPLYLRALQISERQLGPEHPSTATSLNNLAFLYQSQGKYAEAEPLYLRALQISERQLGPEHPSTATSLNNLAFLYQSQGKYAEAEPLYLRALQIRERQLGPEHPDTATSLNNLAFLYQSQGKYAEAEPLYLRALQISERQLGPEHPSTATSLNNLAFLYQSQGKYAEAEPLYLRALQISERQLGPEHPSTATSLNNLAFLYQSQGKYAEAKPLYLRALTIYKQRLGPQHPNTMTVQENYASLLRAMGRDDEATSPETNQTPSSQQLD